MSDIQLPPDPASELAEIIRSITGVRGVYGARPALVGAVVRVATRVEPSPVALSVTDDEVRVSVEIAVSAASTAPITARAVGDAVRAWCADTHPLLRPEIAIRVSFVE
ncbi:hypothetical protein HQQ80_09270 [Microbacteriaceae bacterium VKM Ac-2855]|nr:hypothetical protein [Microbacteriaceae bacterium VKM Ac-2855]